MKVTLPPEPTHAPSYIELMARCDRRTYISVLLTKIWNFLSRTSEPSECTEPLNYTSRKQFYQRINGQLMTKILSMAVTLNHTLKKSRKKTQKNLCGLSDNY